MVKVKRSAQYELRPLPIPASYKRIPRVHPFLVNSTLKTSDYLANEIQSRCSLNRADVVSALDALSAILYETLSEGDRVELAGIGNFSISLTCPPTMAGEEIHAQSVTVRRINFTPSASLSKKLRQIPLERAPQRIQQNDTPLSQQLLTLGKWFSTHPSLTRMQYQQLFSCSRQSAYNALQELTEGGYLHKIGPASHPNYISVSGKLPAG